MAHATETLTNGDKSQSKFLSHLTSYPAVHDGIETYKTNPYGKKSLELADGAYARFGKPVEPYLQKPYGYAAPYVQKADELADSGLSKVETHFPIVKEDTNTVVDTAKSYAFWPYNYISGTWNDEYTKTARHNDRGPGISTAIMALISVNLKIAADVFQVLADTLGPKYEESKKKSADYVRNAQENLNGVKENAQQKASEAQKAGEEKKEQAKDQAKQTKDEAKKQANK
ncbi:putative melanoma-associated antigen [Septoria linicola]|nr:putative melanoma-associated antigen [Septoria linicola]